MIKTCPFNLADASPRILWEITARCNLRCKHCLYFSDGAPACRDLSLEQIRTIIDAIAEDGRIKEIWLSGGEPMMRRDILDIIGAISEKGLVPSLSSNATLIDAGNAPRLYERGIRYVHVSIDGIDAATHDSLRGVKGAFDKTLRGVEALREAGIAVGASFMATEESVDQLEQMADLAFELGISTVSFYQVEPLGRAAGKSFGQRDKLARSMAEAQRAIETKYAEHPWRLEFPRLFNGEGGPLEQCHAEKFLTITADGMLGVCPWLMKSEGAFIGGNLLEMSLDEAWPRCASHLEDVMRARKQNSVCRQCPDADRCAQGCPAVSRYTDEFPYGFDPACRRLA